MKVAARDVQDAWELLASLGPGDDDLRVREIEGLATAAGTLLFGLGPAGERHVLIPVPAGSDVEQDRRSGGVQVVAHKLLDGGAPRLFVDVVCLKPHLHEIFSVLATEMLNLLEQDASRPDRTCRQVLDWWRELLDRGRSQAPSIDTLTGIFGEVFQLRELVRRDARVVECWVGPTGARHDFVGRDHALEVKATRSRRGRFFEVSGHEQLEPPPGGVLHLAAMRLEEAPGDGESIRDVLDEIVDLEGDPHTLFARVEQAGLGLDQLETAGRTRFRVVESLLYLVDDAFPRIVAASFVSGRLPPGVLAIQYQIDLSTDRPAPLEAPAVDATYRAMAASALR